MWTATVPRETVAKGQFWWSKKTLRKISKNKRKISSSSQAGKLIKYQVSGNLN